MQHAQYAARQRLKTFDMEVLTEEAITDRFFVSRVLLQYFNFLTVLCQAFRSRMRANHKWCRSIQSREASLETSNFSRELSSKRRPEATIQYGSW